MTPSDLTVGRSGRCSIKRNFTGAARDCLTGGGVDNPCILHYPAPSRGARDRERGPVVNPH
ncbi:hypothetical protein Mapa_011676 [Marchantia paleacea]|nr:hypothetical protein Mapa_011676 [Marchantia paleacea]